MLPEARSQTYYPLNLSGSIPTQRWLFTSTLLRSLRLFFSPSHFTAADDIDARMTPTLALPAHGTVLHLTLAELYAHSMLDSEVMLERTAGYTLRDLVFSPQDQLAFQQYAIFPDDALCDVLRLSIRYLLHMRLSEDGLLRLLTALFPQQRHIGDMPLGSMVRATAAEAIFSGLDFSLLSNGHLSALIIHEPLLASLAALNITTWQELITLTEFQLLYHLGVNMHTLATIFTLWQLREEMMIFLAEVTHGIALEAYQSFESLVETFLRKTGASKRELDILQGRWGLLEGRKWTQEELAQREDVSRERIYQIERKRVKACYTTGHLASILHFWVAVNDALVSRGGVMLARDLAIDLMSYFDWTVAPHAECLANFLSLWPQCKLIWENPIRVEWPSHPCLYCECLPQVFPHLLTQAPEETLTCEQACELLQQQCRTRCSLQRPFLPSFSTGYLFHLTTQLPEITLDEDRCYSSRAWTLWQIRRRQFAFTANVD